MREVYRSDILPRNRNSFYNYFDVWWWVAMMVCGVEQSLLDNMPDVSYDRFQDYVELEEARIKGNLEKIKYHIDASDTLALVLGPGRMENVRRSDHDFGRSNTDTLICSGSRSSRCYICSSRTTIARYKLRCRLF